jgi:V/A-type H+/Na+-transporting ATPase subunit E
MEAKASVKDLIDIIKKEGIEESRKNSEAVLDEAKKNAEHIVQQAKVEAEAIVSEAKKEAKRAAEAGEKALVQAGRNLLISLREEITRLFKKVTEREVSSVLTPEIMKEMILKIIEKWKADKGESQLEVLLNEKDIKKLEDALLQAVRKEWKKGVFLKPLEGVQAGFRIGEKEGSIHYNFTEQGLAEILGEYLNPRLARFLKE